VNLSRPLTRTTALSSLFASHRTSFKETFVSFFPLLFADRLRGTSSYCIMFTSLPPLDLSSTLFVVARFPLTFRATDLTFLVYNFAHSFFVVTSFFFFAFTFSSNCTSPVISLCVLTAHSSDDECFVLKGCSHADLELISLLYV